MTLPKDIPGQLSGAQFSLNPQNTQRASDSWAPDSRILGSIVRFLSGTVEPNCQSPICLERSAPYISDSNLQIKASILAIALLFILLVSSCLCSPTSLVASAKANWTLSKEHSKENHFWDLPC